MLIRSPDPPRSASGLRLNFEMRRPDGTAVPCAVTFGALDELMGGNSMLTPVDAHITFRQQGDLLDRLVKRLYESGELEGGGVVVRPEHIAQLKR
jgi:hypothetical protein